MAKNKTLQRYILKINSTRIIKDNYDLSLSLEQARENGELIALSENNLMRYIDYLNKQENVSEQISNIKRKIKNLKKIKDIKYSKPKIIAAYTELDNLIYKKDYINVVIDTPNDYRKLVENGFKINGIEFSRLLGTPGGVKKNTITFVNKDLYPQIKDFVDCGRNLTQKFIPAKLEAYKALVCSASIPVSWPKGVIVINDCVTEFYDTYIKLDDTNSDNPKEELVENGLVQLIENDGYGMAMPELMQRWGEELGEEYIISGAVIRNAYCKGAIFPIDFQKFCKEHNVEYVRDVWGVERKISEVELVLTESMLKLWDSYTSMEEYLENCNKFKYTFSITKNTEEELENQRTTNYQFIQSYDFTDEDIEELIKDTVTSINDILSNDYRKTILYMKGIGLNEENIKQSIDGTIGSALIINPEVLKDPFIQSQIYKMIKKRIDDAKIGVLDIPGNYSLVCGDPYSLCQHMCGLNVTGLLKAHQVYSKYWIDKGIDKIATFRAPMTSHNNIRILDVVHNDEMDEFYKYCTTPTLFNSWDMCANALNGMDKDGDAVINTSSPILINKAKELPAIECIQRKAEKIIPTDEDMMESNIKSFGNAVGSVTNRVTSMFDVLAGLELDSPEYKEVEHRIKCGQLFQQNAIDKTKGIDAKPMPSEWYVWHANAINKEDTEEVIQQKEFNKKIVADKKPYFMKYIYPTEKKALEKYLKNCQTKCMREYLMTIEELESLENKTDEQIKFLDIYHRKIPMGMNDCVVNRICRKIEKMFDIKKPASNDFDYSIYKLGIDYPANLRNKINELYKEYEKSIADYMIKISKERVKDDQKQIEKFIFKDMFKRKAEEICPNGKMLTEIILDICYKNNISKQFAWDICGEEIIDNLLLKSNYRISYPTIAADGDIEFSGEKFKMINANMEEDFNMIVLNEVKQAERIIEFGEIGKKPSAIIGLLAKYYRQEKKLSVKETISELDGFMEKNYPYYNKVLWDETIEKMANNGNKYSLRKLEKIEITDTEIAKIQELKDIKEQKILFTMLVFAKVYNTTNPENNNWVNTSEGDIFKSAHVHVGQTIDKAKILHNLKEKECIIFSKKNENLNMQVNIISDGNVVIEINDLEDLGFEYEKYIGNNKIKKCEICGKLIKVTNNKQRFCKPCGKQENIRKTLQSQKSLK